MLEIMGIIFTIICNTNILRHQGGVDMLGQTDLVVVEYHGNYADEFDVDATKVMSYIEYLELIMEYTECFKFGRGEIEIYFGTNEFIVMDGSKEFSFKFITNTEYLTLVKYGLEETGFSQILEIYNYAERN